MGLGKLAMTAAKVGILALALKGGYDILQKRSIKEVNKNEYRISVPHAMPVMMTVYDSIPVHMNANNAMKQFDYSINQGEITFETKPAKMVTEDKKDITLVEKIKSLYK